MLAWLPVSSGAQENAPATAPTTAPVTVGEGADEKVAGELVVIFEDQAANAAPSAVAEDAEGRIQDSIPDLDARLLSFPEIKERSDEGRQEQALEAAKEELEADPRVESVSYNGIVRASLRPNDPDVYRQSGVITVRADQAWNTTTGEGATIAVVDTGIQADHPDITGKVIAQRDFVDDDDVGEDVFGHGTHVAGIAAATMNNNEGIAGICPDCRLVNARVLNARGFGTDFQVAQGIDYAADEGVDVVNLSLGDAKDAPVLEKAVNRAWALGAVVVGAAGNEGNKPVQYPAAYPKAIAVSATDTLGKFVSFSNRGRAIDLAAPGVGIYSTVPTDAYATYSGTSMSAPHVAGVAGLLAGQGLNNERIRERLQCTAKDMGAGGRDDLYGHGLLDARAAVTETCPRRPNPQPARCTITGTSKANVLRGTPRRDVICALGGNDVVQANRGEDLLKGGSGNDVLAGGPGKDTLSGGPGRDSCYVTKGDRSTSCRRLPFDVFSRSAGRPLDG